jgi:hypothetical protein
MFYTLAKYVAFQPLVIICSVLVFCAGVYTYDDPITWSYVYLSAIVLFGVLFFDNKNLLSILLVLAIDVCLTEGRWFIRDDINELRLILYFVTLVISILLFSDVAAKFTFFTVIAVCLGEIYWLKTGYDKRPVISYFVTNLLALLLMRYLVWNRTRLLSDRLLFGGLNFVLADWYLYSLLMGLVVLNCADIFEYLLRHIFMIDSILVYTVYPYIGHTVGVAYLLVVLLFSFQTSSKKAF